MRPCGEPKATDSISDKIASGLEAFLLHGNLWKIIEFHAQNRGGEGVLGGTWPCTWRRMC